MSRDRDLAELAMDQWGMVTTGQARSAGVTAQVMAKMARGGSLVRLSHGVYRLAGSPIDQHEELRAAWLALDPLRSADERIGEPDVEVVSHRSATTMRALGDLDSDVLEFTAPARRQTRRPDVRLHRGRLTKRDWSLVGGLPVTTALRTIDDLAAERIDRGHLAGIVRDALAGNLVTEADLEQVLARHARGYGGRAGEGEALLNLLFRDADMPDKRAASPVTASGRFDPDSVRRVIPILDKKLLLSMAGILDPELLRAIAPSLDPELLRSLLSRLDSAPTRSILSERDPPPVSRRDRSDDNVDRKQRIEEEPDDSR